MYYAALHKVAHVVDLKIIDEFSAPAYLLWLHIVFYSLWLAEKGMLFQYLQLEYKGEKDNG